MTKSKLKIIPIGGLGEIGKNMMLVEYENDIIIIDVGLMFPEEPMLGVDLVIPDVSYLMDKKEKIRGIIITHGHEDHIGAMPYILPQLNVPVYSTKLTNGLISVKLKEQKVLANADLRVVPNNGQFTLGAFNVEFFPVCHSIPDAVGLIINTPVGTIVHSGDFKLDYTPVSGNPTDLAKLAQIGSQGVLLLMSDSTYAELPGYTLSEKLIGESMDRIMSESPGRVIIATFSSLISRIQQIIDAAAKYGRRVCVVGRNMIEIVRMALAQGYLNDTENVLAKIEDVKNLPHKKIVFITTGTQGEPTSALVRIANRSHRQIHIMPGDTVAFSSTPIPGNEAVIARTIDNLYKQGAQVIYNGINHVHVHGHASQEELKLLLNIVKPKYFVPVHGEYRHLSIHAKLAHSVGIPKENIFVMEDGDTLELDQDSAEISGHIASTNVYVDGLSVGDIDTVVLHDRRMLSRDGMVVVIIAINKQTGKPIGRPDIVSRGFVDPQGYKEMLESSCDMVMQMLNNNGSQPAEWGVVNSRIKDTLNKYYYERTKLRPMILPFMVKV